MGNTSAIFHTWALLSLMNSRLDKNEESRKANIKCNKRLNANKMQDNSKGKKNPFYMCTEMSSKCPVISVL